MATPVKDFSFAQFGLRFLFALLLVLFTYNPSGYSFSHWLYTTFPSFSPAIGLSGSALLIAWAIFIRASLRSLGLVGLSLAAIFFACLVWFFVDLGWLSLVNVSVFGWVVLCLLALVLAFGISWSHIRRRITGQVDADDVGD